MDKSAVTIWMELEALIAVEQCDPRREDLVSVQINMENTFSNTAGVDDLPALAFIGARREFGSAIINGAIDRLATREVYEKNHVPQLYMDTIGNIAA